MKKIIFLSLISGICTIGTNAAALQWWQQPTICRISTTNCYSAMGAGYDRELWDTSGNCRGMKLICPEALKSGGNEPIAMGKSALAAQTDIKDDFDTSALAGDCFGARKTQKNGLEVSVNGKFVNVYCPGILTNPTEIVATGEITTGRQPTCQDLADDGYAAVENGKCYGKYYSPSDYYIDCGAAQKPTRIIVLNGADYTSSATNTPDTQVRADTLFRQMQTTSASQRAKYFNITE